MAFALDKDYIDVAHRIVEFRAKYPEGSLQSEIIEVPAAFADKFVAVKAYAYRTPDDPRPGIGLAWEPIPGKTSFTKDSELQNAETAAWGRAIVAVGAADTKQGIASAEEIRSREEPAAPTPVQQVPRPEPPAAARAASGGKITTATKNALAKALKGKDPKDDLGACFPGESHWTVESLTDAEGMTFLTYLADRAKAS